MSLAIEALLDGEAEALTRHAIEMALEGAVQPCVHGHDCGPSLFLCHSSQVHQGRSSGHLILVNLGEHADISDCISLLLWNFDRPWRLASFARSNPIRVVPLSVSF